ncbi:MAG: hypothetical protein EBT15_07295 [Betaproteobacteria bacterium]|nr:hypothetical protein [Betaproteobacteria bacterium]
MAKTRRRVITKEERAARTALMRATTWAVVRVMQRLFQDGKTTDEVAGLYDRIFREASNEAALHADWHAIDSMIVAGTVYVSVRGA